MKFNPGLLSHEDRIARFVVRTELLDTIVGTLRGNAASESNQHLLVIGPRGSGKSMLVRRVETEIRRVLDLSETWIPIVFGEEAYEIETIGEFWLMALEYLAEQTNDPDCRAAHRDIFQEQNHTRLRDRAISALVEQAIRWNKRLVLIVENLNTLFVEQLDENAGWELRQTLQTEPRIMILGTATGAFDAIEDSNQALYEFFGILNLNPLSAEECETLWRALTRPTDNVPGGQALLIVTGGNPRLLSMLAEFYSRESFGDFAESIVELIDDNTEYFKGALENLSPKDRKVFTALLDLWNPATAREVAVRARMEPVLTSSLLNRLAERGIVRIVREEKRRRHFQASDRLFSLYYLIRHGGDGKNRLVAAVKLISALFSNNPRVDLLRAMTRQLVAPGANHHTLPACEELIRAVPDRAVQRIVLAEIPSEFFKLHSPLDSFRKKVEPSDPTTEADWLDVGHGYFNEENFEAALNAYHKALELNPDSARVIASIAQVRHIQGNFEAAREGYEKALKLKPQSGLIWRLYGDLLFHDLNLPREAERAYRRTIDCWQLDDTSQVPPDYLAGAYAFLGLIQQKEYEDYVAAEQYFRKAIDLDPDESVGWFYLGELLHRHLGRYEEAEKAYREGLGIDPESHYMAILGELLHRHLNRIPEAIELYGQYLKIDPDNWSVYALRGEAFLELRKYGQALIAYQAALVKKSEITPEEPVQYQLTIPEILRCTQPIDRWIARIADILAAASDQEMLAKRVLWLAHHKLDRFPLAFVWYKGFLKAFPNEADVWAAYGEYLYRLLENNRLRQGCSDLYGEAFTALRRAVQLDPELASAWGHIGEMNHRYFGNAQAAEEAYRTAWELLRKPESAVAAKLSVALMLGELTGVHKRNPSEGERWFREAIQLDARSVEAWLGLGGMLDFSGRSEEAMDAYRRVLDIDPNDGLARVNLLLLRIRDDRGANLDRLKQDVATFLDSIGRKGPQVGVIANQLCQYEKTVHLGEELAGEVLAKEPGNVPAWFAVMAARRTRSDWDGVLEMQREFLIQLGNAHDWFTIPEHRGMLGLIGQDLIVSAANGKAQEVLNLLAASPLHADFEILEVALRMYLGEDVLAADFIADAARAVVKRIQDLKEKRDA